MLMPSQLATTVGDVLDNCACIEAGQRVLILAANDGLYGGPNLVDEAVIGWIQKGVQERKAHPSILWLDLTNQPHAWRVPPLVKGALANTDVFISHALDLPFEELLELRDILAEHRVPMIRNMATTALLFDSAWAQTPYELVSEIRFQAASPFRAGLRWTIRSPLGTHLQGIIGTPLPPFKHYGERRSEGLYRPFPEGVFTPVTAADTEGVLVFDRTLSWWARYLGVSPCFTEPVRVEIQSNRVIRFEGGQEAKALERFYATMAKRFGEMVYEIAGLHGGVHPHASVSPRECPDAAYREFIEHHHAGSMHLHLGHVTRTAEYPYMWHITAELRGATWQVGSKVIYDQGRLCSLDCPEVQAVASRYPGRPGIPFEV